MSGPTHYCLRCYSEMDITAAAANTDSDEAACVACGLQYIPRDERTFISFDILSPWATYLLAFLVLLFGAGFFLLTVENNWGGRLPDEPIALDKNGDGKVSIEELPLADRELFSDCDHNSNNFLEEQELQFYQEVVRAGQWDYRRGVGWVLVLGLPICLGAVLGYTSSPRRFKLWQKVIIGILIFCGILVILGLLLVSGIFGSAADGIGLGLFCAVMLGLVFILPFLLGDSLGYVIRRRDERNKRNWKWTRVVIFLLLPFGLDAVERLLPRDEDIASVETHAVFSSSQERAWNSIVFYEQIEHAPPFLLRLALPRPVGTTGGKTKVGETSRCVYENGYLVKKISEREEGRLLGFRVIEQNIHFEHDLDLRGGSFRVEPGPDPGTTRVTLTTSYRRLTYPAFIWQPAETLVLHTLHGHVLEGMRANAERGLAVDPVDDASKVIGRLEFPAAGGR